MDAKNKLKVKEVADDLDLTPQTIYNFIEDDKIPYIELPNGRYRILERDYLDWIQDHRRERSSS